MPELTADELLLRGWEVERASFFDEEGVDGWIWTAPDGKTYEEIGCHHEDPVVPDIELGEIDECKDTCP